MTMLAYGAIQTGITKIIRTAHHQLAKVNITMQSNFFDDLGINSLDIVELTLLVEEEFRTGPIAEKYLYNVNTVGDMVTVVAKILYPTELEYVDICKILHHGPGFIMVDRVTSLELDMDPPQIRAIYNVSGSAWWAKEHFPGNPMMPGVLMLEGLNQVGGLLLYYLSGRKKRPLVFTGFGSGLIRKSAVPGDRVEYFVELSKKKRGIHTLHSNVTINGFRCLKVDVKLATT